MNKEPKVRRFADLHCHVHMRSFNWLHKPRKELENNQYHPWWIILPNLKAVKKGIRASSYSQSDIVRMINGKVNLGFVSLSPVEKGWVIGRKGSLKVMAVNFRKVLGDTLLNVYVSRLANFLLDRPTFLIGRDKENRWALRDILQTFFMNIPFSKVNFFQNPKKYNYYNEFNNEKKYLDKKDTEPASSQLFIPTGKRVFINKKKLLAKYPRELVADGTYVIAKNGQHVKEIIEQGNTAFVLTVEGGYVFNSEDEETEAIIERIKEVKSWEQSLFFVALTHHFNNDLGGHAHSIPDIGNLVIDQTKGMYEGMLDKGRDVIRCLLGIDNNGEYQTTLGPRILIDVKHMNWRTRRDYYNEFVIPSLSSANPIPVVGSHMAFSGRETFEDFEAHWMNEHDRLSCNRFEHIFNAWNINLCDEDVLIIHRSKGLIGINLDQRILGVTKDDANNLDSHSNYIWQQMRAMLKVIDMKATPEAKSAYNATSMFCLGTDFDGFIDPINKYPTALEFSTLADDLVTIIQGDEKNHHLLNDLTPEAFVQKFCFDNAFEFVVGNFVSDIS